MSLLEVLASIGVLSIGLLGLASLLPVGRYIIGEATKADHAGDCGRAALRDVIVRRMLASSNWVGNPGGAAFVIDPLGVANGLGTFGGPANLPRISLANTSGFQATDDLIVPLPEELTPPQAVGRPVSVLNYNGDYSWFLTVVPTPNSPTRFTVSVVVCGKRDYTEVTAPVATFCDPSVGSGGGSIILSNSFSPLQVKENDWIALCSTQRCGWYRVAAVGDDGVSLTVIGPDWNTSQATTAVALGQSVLGVYTTTIELDTDPTWTN
jgi:hypothetical protein